MPHRHHLRTWLHAARTTTHDTPATEAANPRVQGRDGVWARDGVLHAAQGAWVPPEEVAGYRVGKQGAQDPRQPAVGPVEALAPHVRVIPRDGQVWTSWEVVDGSGRVRAHGSGHGITDAAAKGAQILEILSSGGIDGVAL